MTKTSRREAKINLAETKSIYLQYTTLSTINEYGGGGNDIMGFI